GVMRCGAQLGVYSAAVAENEGRVEEGLAIRRALARAGGAIRVQSRSVIGSTVGFDLVQTAEIRPGSRQARTTMYWLAGASDRKRLEAYCAYLDRIGHPEAARWMRAEVASA